MTYAGWPGGRRAGHRRSGRARRGWPTPGRRAGRVGPSGGAGERPAAVTSTAGRASASIAATRSVGVGRVQRQVGGTGLEHREDRDDHVGGARQRQRDHVLRARAPGGQQPGQPVGPLRRARRRSVQSPTVPRRRPSRPGSRRPAAANRSATVGVGADVPAASRSTSAGRGRASAAAGRAAPTGRSGSAASASRTRGEPVGEPPRAAGGRSSVGPVLQAAPAAASPGSPPRSAGSGWRPARPASTGGEHAVRPVAAAPGRRGSSRTISSVSNSSPAPAAAGCRPAPDTGGRSAPTARPGPGQQCRDRLGRVEAHPHRHGVDEQPDHRLDPGHLAGRPETVDAEDHVVPAGEPAQHDAPGGLEHRVQGQPPGPGERASAARSRAGTSASMLDRHRDRRQRPGRPRASRVGSSSPASAAAARHRWPRPRSCPASQAR